METKKQVGILDLFFPLHWGVVDCQWSPAVICTFGVMKKRCREAAKFTDAIFFLE